MIVDFCMFLMQVTYKFRCMVRVMATWPSDVLDFCEPTDGSAAQPIDHPDQGDFVFVVRLTLEDPTARLHAFLYGEDAVSLVYWRGVQKFCL